MRSPAGSVVVVGGGLVVVVVDGGLVVVVALGVDPCPARTVVVVDGDPRRPLSRPTVVVVAGGSVEVVAFTADVGDDVDPAVEGSVVEVADEAPDWPPTSDEAVVGTDVW